MRIRVFGDFLRFHLILFKNMSNLLFVLRVNFFHLWSLGVCCVFLNQAYICANHNKLKCNAWFIVKQKWLLHVLVGMWVRSDMWKLLSWSIKPSLYICKYIYYHIFPKTLTALFVCLFYLLVFWRIIILKRALIRASKTLVSLIHLWHKWGAPSKKNGIFWECFPKGVGGSFQNFCKVSLALKTP